MNSKLQKLKETMDGWKNEWQVRMMEATRARLSVRSARERFQLARDEYNKEKRKP